MTRDALLALLLAYVNAGHLTRDDARAVVAAHDEGDLPDDFGLEPVAAGAALVALLRAAVRAGRLRLAQAAAARYGFALPAGATGDGAAVRAILGSVDRLPLASRVSLIDAVRADDIRGALVREVERRTAALKAAPELARLGGAPGTAHRAAGDVARWQRAMRAAYAEDAAALARLGAGGDLSPAQLRRLASVVADKAAYVDGFAGRLATDAAGLTKPLSERQIRAAIIRNSGDARGLFFENAVAAESAGLSSPVAYYVPKDDPVTCGPCSEAGAGSPYLVSAVPVPGSICLGRGWCRCEVRVEDDPDAFARLSGRTLSQAA